MCRVDGWAERCIALPGHEDEVIARLTAGPSGDPGLPETAHRRFGDVAAGVGMLQRLDAITVIDSVVGAALSGGVSVATYLGLAALNRVCEPKELGFASPSRSGRAPAGGRAPPADDRGVRPSGGGDGQRDPAPG